MTSLSLYANTIAATSLATAGLFVDGTGGTGGSNSTKNTLCGTASGYGEIYAQGNASAWPSLGSIPGTPSGHGFLYDQNTLEGFQIPSGNWGGTQRIGVSASSVMGDLYVRAYIYNITSHVYTLIGTIPKASITPSGSNIALTSTILPLANFSTGDRLYLAYWLNILTPSSSGTCNLVFTESGTSGQGDGNAKVTTPGYVLPSTSWHMYGNEGLVY